MGSLVVLQTKIISVLGLQGQGDDRAESDASFGRLRRPGLPFHKLGDLNPLQIADPVFLVAV